MRAASLALVIFAAGCVRAAAPVVPPPAPPPPLATHVADDPHLTVCVVRNGVLADIQVSYDPATGDSLYEGRRFGDAFPTDSAFAGSAAWYHATEPILVLNRMYVKFGLPRALRPGDLVLRGRYRGVPVYADVRDSHQPPYLLYLPVRPTCEFQPYETEMGGPVRGR